MRFYMMRAYLGFFIIFFFLLTETGAFEKK